MNLDNTTGSQDKLIEAAQGADSDDYQDHINNLISIIEVLDEKINILVKDSHNIKLELSNTQAELDNLQSDKEDV